MAGNTETEPVIDSESYPLGTSRPPLGVDDLPEPEEVFKVSRLGPWQIVQFVIGPSLIALGISIGSGEWLLGPQAIGTFGFVGIGWVITVSAILQTFYNVEVSRYVVATGEVPIVGWGRVPPGWKFWIPFSLIVFYFAFIFGGWAASAGQGLFALIVGRVHEKDELEYTRLLAIGLLFVVFLICVLARKISRALELSNWVIVGSLLAILIVVDIAIVPPSVWWEGIRGLVTPAAPPEGITATTLGGLAGFTALASGLNWYAMSHYRDHGYGMGHRVGFIAGMRGQRQELLAVGRHLPGHARERFEVEALVPATARRSVDRVLRRRDDRDAAADDPDGAHRRHQRRGAHGGECADVRRREARRAVRAGNVLPHPRRRGAHPVLHAAGHLRGCSCATSPMPHTRRAPGCAGCSRAIHASSTTRTCCSFSW